MARLSSLLHRRSSVVRVAVACGEPEFAREDSMSQDENADIRPRDRLLMNGAVWFRICRIVLG